MNNYEVPRTRLSISEVINSNKALYIGSVVGILAVEFAPRSNLYWFAKFILSGAVSLAIEKPADNLNGAKKSNLDMFARAVGTSMISLGLSIFRGDFNQSPHITTISTIAALAVGFGIHAYEFNNDCKTGNRIDNEVTIDLGDNINPENNS